MTTTDFSRFYCLVFLLACLFTSCRRETVKTIPPGEFTKDQRETLGLMLKKSIDSNPETFRLLPNEPPYDTSIYWFIQRLYDQATNVMRIDHQSPTDNRWTVDRNWDVHILISDEINAFVLPGGYFYITTGFLETLSEEYELYYILSFEANLMDKGMLLERLVSEVNSTKLTDMAARDLDPKHENVKALAYVVSHLAFSTDEVQENDQYTVTDICNTSQWNRMGLLPLLENLDDNMEWLTYRPSYNHRAEWLLDFLPSSFEDCGSLKTNNPSNEGYQKFVLDVLN